MNIDQRFKTLIVDDDPLVCDLLQHFCSKNQHIKSHTTVINGKQALNAVHSDDFDVIFLDFNLPDLKADLLLEKLPHNLPVIMITSEISFGAKSYDYDQIIDFLTKPIRYTRFSRSIERLLSKTQSNNTYKKNTLLVKDGNATVVIKIDEIRYIKSESNYVVFYLNEKKVMSLMSLKNLEIQLPENFVRVQKSYIVNLNFLEELRTEHLIIDGTQIPIGAKHKDKVSNRVKGWND